MPSAKAIISGAVLLSSLLLFLVEPMSARLLLPVFGGSTSLWLTCLVFFQVVLLIGYMGARLLANASVLLLRVYMGLLLVAAAAALGWGLPAARTVTYGGGAHPFLAVLLELTLTIGLPFVVLSATAPLMQAWWARLHGDAVPYRLYALSNAASLGALLLYPTLVEPLLTLRMQRLLWSVAFVLFAMLSLLVVRSLQGLPVQSTLPVPSAPHRVEEPAATPPRTRLLWFLLPLAASMQLSAVTAHLSANVAAIPLLWIPPLATYLLTLIAAFQFPSLARHRGILLRFLAVFFGSFLTIFLRPLLIILLHFLLAIFLRFLLTISACNLLCTIGPLYLRLGCSAITVRFV